MSLPIITVTGNVRKIETKQAGNKNITKVNVSCGQKKKDGTWDNLYITAEFWEKGSDFVSQHFREGSAITVTGKLYTNTYSKSDGTKVYENKFMFPEASFVPKDQEAQPMQQAPQQQGYSQPQQGYQPPAQSAPQVPEIDMDSQDIPF
jgi:single-stranded DNA-binding protein